MYLWLGLLLAGRSGAYFEMMVPILGWWGLAFFGDFPNASMLAGMALIAGAGAFTAWRERRLNRVAPSPPVR